MELQLWVLSTPLFTGTTRNFDAPGNFGDCMEGRIRLVIAITATDAHAYQSLCLAGRMLDVPHQPETRIFSTLKPQHDKDNHFQGWAIYTDGGTRCVEGETLHMQGPEPQ